MFFNSIDFAVFFPIVFVLYWFFSKNLTKRNLLILGASYLFYGWWDWRFLVLILISSLVDFIIGIKLYESTSKKQKNIYLIISLFVNLGLLVYFKYTNFFIETFVESFIFFGKKIDNISLNIILPVGISFYTFQTLSYSIDIYRNQLKPTKNWLAFFSFVSFFPQLVAGPIERASHLLPQFYKTYKFNYKLVKSGLLLIVFGLFKKMVIADRAALYVNEVYNNVDGYTGVEYFYATVFFAVQIYCDFSGYSDIAIGVARTMGFDLMKNFDSPYFSKSLTEFWRRWHISLSTWFRDYVFIPLGGSRKGKMKTYFNLFIVFVISGLWHGAAITFIIWGAIHGLILIVEKASLKFKNKIFKRIHLDKNSHFIKLFFSLLTFFIVCLAWVFFRANSLADAVIIIDGIFNQFNLGDVFLKETYLIGFKPNEFRVLIGSITILIMVELLHKKYSLVKRLNAHGIVFRWFIYFLMVFVIIIFGKYGDEIIKEFIYFQF
ncbi:MBOAT family protein [Polaribacter vadi]|uniref:MBOAT family O-acyltransferase n=1 Tax=Polaribacter TaxID=52959 RepID=UPI001C081DEB|nr:MULTISPECIES: MBOAT family O-acyltransferase [Polaribacter]MBU3011830.1 MBOAT family protein [Polaribacter vadi]MDO6741643.1 MBOAT family O-acyltransferase [Polaribacter sp. 1_MG-2023]